MRQVCAAMLFLILGVGAALEAQGVEEDTFQEALSSIRAVADGYPPRLEGPDDRGEVEEAWRKLETRLLAEVAKNESDAEIRILLGDLYRMGHNLDIEGSGDKAIDHLGHAIMLDPANPTPHHLLGRHFTFSNEFQEGEVALLKAYARVEPSEASEILFDLTWNSYFRQDYPSAILFADRYLTTVPDSEAIAFIRERAKEAIAGREVRTIKIEADGPPEGKLKTMQNQDERPES